MANALETGVERTGAVLQAGCAQEAHAALERAKRGEEATEQDRRHFRIAADVIDSLYDGSIIPEHSDEDDFDRAVLREALYAERADARALAETMSSALAVMGEGYTADEESIETLRDFFARYRQMHAEATS